MPQYDTKDTLIFIVAMKLTCNLELGFIFFIFFLFTHCIYYSDDCDLDNCDVMMKFLLVLLKSLLNVIYLNDSDLLFLLREILENPKMGPQLSN